MNIRFLICAYPLLMLITPMFMSAAESTLSIVKVADLLVYSNTSTASQVVKTLHQGDRVVVKLEINTGHSWCKICEENRTEELGYVLCQGLDRPQSTSQKQWNQVPSQSQSTAADVTQPKKTDMEASARESDAMLSVRDPDLWAKRFKFSDEQRLKGDALLRSSGVPACKNGVEKIFRANGIYDAYSIVDFLKRHGKNPFAMEMARIGAELDRCGAVYFAFWNGFVQLLNSDQKTQLAKEPLFLLFLSNLNSDASTEFGLYVLSQMKSR